MADNLLDKASILLTPTAYNDGRMLSVKPEVAFGEELSTNGDFSNGTTGWSNGSSTLSVVDGKLKILATGAFSYARQNITVVSGKKYKITVNFFYNSLVGNIEVYDGTTNTISEQLSKDGVITLSITPSSTNLRLTLLNRNGVSGDFNYWDNVSVVEDLSGDFTFSRSSAATRVNAQGLVENVQIISSELVSNGNFSQIGTEEVSNGNFSQEGSELVTNGDFSNGLTNWYVDDGTSWTNVNNTAFCDGNNGLIAQNIVSTQNKVYKVTFDSVATNSSGKELGVRIDGGTYSWNLYPTGTHTIYLTAGSNSIEGILFYALNGWTGSIDNVSVKEVGQDWTLGSGWSIGEDKAISDGTSSNLDQSDTFLSGKTYKVVYTIEDYVSGDTRFRFTGTSNENGTLRSANGTYTEYITLTNNQSILRFFGFGILSITNISVKEVGQDWTFGTGWSMEDRAFYNDSATNQLSQSISLTSGVKYKLTFDIELDTVNQAYIWIGNSGGSVNYTGTNYVFYPTGSHTVYFTMPSSQTTLAFYGNQTGGAFYITNISVKEITDDTDLPRINYEGFSYQDSLGSEEVVNGDFATDSNWSKSGWSIQNGQAINTASASGNNLYQGSVTSVGGNFKVVITTTITAGSVVVMLGGGSGGYNVIGEATTSGTFTYYGVSNGTDNRILLQTGNGTLVGSVSIDNVSVKEYLGQEVVPDSGCGSWLLEPQSTNLIPYSEDFSASSWGKTNSSITSNLVISPDGALNADKLVENTSTGEKFTQTIISVSNTTIYTASVFVKFAGREWIRFTDAQSSNRIHFNTKTGVFGAVTGTVISYNSIALDNGWYKLSLTTTSVASAYAIRIVLAENDNDVSYQGDGTSGVYVWGAQLEEQSYATSYIPTNGAANTRLQDIANNSGNSTLINSTEGVLYYEASYIDGSDYNSISISNNSGSEKLRTWYDNTNLVFANFVNNVNQTFIAYPISKNINYKIAVRYKLNDFALYVNGTKATNIVVNLGGVSPQNSYNKLNFNSGDIYNNFFGKNKALAVYKEALTDANLRSLTYPNPVATTFDLDFDTIAEQFTFTRGSEATFVNAQGLIESTASNDAPRIDYSTGEKAFLLENQSTNLITYSEDLSDSSWLKSQLTESLSDINSPDGTQNAYKLTESNSSSKHQIFRSIASYTELTISFFAKKAERSFISVEKSSWGTTVFNLNDGSVVSGNGSVVDFGNGWYRCSASYTASPAQSQFYILLMQDGSTTSYQGDGTSGLYLFGIQAESLSYSTSYIPTSGASATRNQELCNNATPVINSEEGTLYAEISALADDLSFRVVSISDGTNNNTIKLGYRSDTNAIYVEVKSASVGTVFLVYTTTSITDFHKIAFKYRLNDFSLWIDGVNVLNDSSGSVPIGLSQLSFNRGDVNNSFFGNTKGLKYYPKALADVQLEDLTTI